MNQAILAEARTYVSQFFKENLPEEYVYHDWGHTLQVVQSCKVLGEAYHLSENDLAALELAAWFHDIGYTQGPIEHEARSAEHLAKYAKEVNIDASLLANAQACILATKMPQAPKQLIEQIICDADLSHLGNDNYWDRTRRVRQELMVIHNKIFTEKEWLDFELDFMDSHEYKTSIAHDLYGKQKLKHTKQLNKLKAQLFPELLDLKGGKKKKKKKKKLKEAARKNERRIKEFKRGRGVETMYRTTYRTHVNLSSIADNKANIMLSINAIIISIVISTLLPSFDDNPKLIIPTIILLVSCLVAVIYATLSTRPKITEGKFTREDIENKKANLLFFGNFYNMPLTEFHWGMMEMIKDSDFLYSSMTRDLYFLGVVLAKKYRYLSICYNVFMYGLVLAVIAFAIAFMWPTA